LKRVQSPIRVEKVEEIKQILTNNKKITASIFEKLEFIFAERTKIEKGLSIKELALILYPNLVTVNEMLAGKKDLETWIKIVMPVINKTKNNILEFRKWTLEERNALGDDHMFVFLYPRKSKPSGAWLYYNVDDLKEAREIDIECARRILIRDKKRKQMEEEKINEILKMKPSKEREEKLALISDLDWVERFNEYSESGFIKRYQQYFSTELDPPLRRFFLIEIEDWDEDLKNELRLLDLSEQYEIISNIIKKNFFEYYSKELKMKESEIESAFMHYTLLLDAGTDLLGNKNKK
jgi:hypothetical protein